MGSGAGYIFVDRKSLRQTICQMGNLDTHRGVESASDRSKKRHVKEFRLFWVDRNWWGLLMKQSAGTKTLTSIAERHMYLLMIESAKEITLESLALNKSSNL